MHDLNRHPVLTVQTGVLSSYLDQWYFQEPGEQPHASLAPLGLRESGGDEVAAHHARHEAIPPRLDPALVEGQPGYEPDDQMYKDSDRGNLWDHLKTLYVIY